MSDLVPAGLADAMLSLARAAAKTSHDVFTVPLMSREEHRRHRRRCVHCNPAAWTAPLRIDGHEYRRRQRSRRQR